MPNRLAGAAAALHQELVRARRRVVLAESCTGGLAAAALAQLPGISEYFCGSAVTYREATKVGWLRVSPRDLERHTAVSEQVARQMAAGVLESTSEAQYSAAITGHLGPHAPPGCDGVVFIAVARRAARRLEVTSIDRLALKSRSRAQRQREAACLLLEKFRLALCGSRQRPRRGL